MKQPPILLASISFLFASPLPSSPSLQTACTLDLLSLGASQGGVGAKEREKGSAIVQRGQSQQLWFRPKNEEVIQCHKGFVKA